MAVLFRQGLLHPAGGNGKWQQKTRPGCRVRLEQNDMH